MRYARIDICYTPNVNMGLPLPLGFGLTPVAQSVEHLTVNRGSRGCKYAVVSRRYSQPRFISTFPSLMTCRAARRSSQARPSVAEFGEAFST